MRTTYVGMDIHKNFIQAAAMDEKGKILREQKFNSTIAGINGFVESLSSSDIKAAIESTCTWYHVYETLHALGIDTTLVNVRRTKVIAESKIKTDKLDAKSIAHCLRTGFIATAYTVVPHVKYLSVCDVMFIFESTKTHNTHLGWECTKRYITLF